MTKYIAFLRAINVGGSKVIKMETLRRIFESLGFTNVASYIQSGNILFDARQKNISSIESKIETGLKDSLGHEVDVVVMGFSDLAAMVENDPFKRIEMGQEVMLFVAFLSEKPVPSAELPIVSATENVEVIALQDRAAFIVARPKKNGRFGYPNNFLEKQLGVSGTTRNWTTVKKIVEQNQGR